MMHHCLGRIGIGLLICMGLGSCVRIIRVPVQTKDRAVEEKTHVSVIAKEDKDNRDIQLALKVKKDNQTESFHKLYHSEDDMRADSSLHAFRQRHGLDSDWLEGFEADSLGLGGVHHLPGRPPLGCYFPLKDDHWEEWEEALEAHIEEKVAYELERSMERLERQLERLKRKRSRLNDE